MSAQILHFPVGRRARVAHDAPRLIRNFEGLLTYQMPTPVWASPYAAECRFAQDDGLRIQEFFRWLGVEVAVDRNHQSLAQGVAYLQSDVCASAAWCAEQSGAPATRGNQWIYSWQVRYFDAVVSGDWIGAAQHLKETPYWPVLQVKMQTPLGTALK